MYKKIEGIVVSEYAYEESSKIIKVFTGEGIISMIAKGAKKPKSPLFATTNKLVYGNFNISYKENTLSRLIEVDILNDYRNIRKDIVKMAYATYITEIALQVYKHDNNRDIFDLYIATIEKINEGYDPLIITNILKLKLLDYLGIRPIIDRCVECGNKSDIVTISSYMGGYVCREHVRDEKIVSTKTIQLIRMLYYVDISKITKLDISDNVKKEIDDFTNDYYERYSGIYLKSKILFDSIK